MNEFHQGADDPPHSAWLRANRYLEADRPTEAERACREGLTSAPDDVDLLVAEAMAMRFIRTPSWRWISKQEKGAGITRLCQMIHGIELLTKVY